jgi:hypothetical protein
MTRPTNDFVVPGAAPHPLSPDEERQARAQLAERCDRPAGRFALSSGTTRVVQFCGLVRSNLLASLSHLEVERGHAALALTLADSALQARRPAWACAATEAHRARGRALLMLGDSTHAATEFAIATGQSLGPISQFPTSFFFSHSVQESARRQALSDSTRRDVQRCMRDNRRWNSALADSARFGVR